MNLARTSILLLFLFFETKIMFSMQKITTNIVKKNFSTYIDPDAQYKRICFNLQNSIRHCQDQQISQKILLSGRASSHQKVVKNLSLLFPCEFPTKKIYSMNLAGLISSKYVQHTDDPEEIKKISTSIKELFDAGIKEKPALFICNGMEVLPAITQDSVLRFPIKAVCADQIRELKHKPFLFLGTYTLDPLTADSLNQYKDFTHFINFDDIINIMSQSDRIIQGCSLHESPY